MQCYFSVTKWTTDFQHAYREGHSICTALTQMTDDWLIENDKKKIVGAVLWGFNAAFIIIDHNLLRTYVLWLFNLCHIVDSELSNRTLRVFFNENFPNVKHVTCGVPQGSSLGPLLFYIFTNDMPLALNKTCVSMYADDSIIYASTTTANKSQRVAISFRMGGQ